LFQSRFLQQGFSTSIDHALADRAACAHDGTKPHRIGLSSLRESFTNDDRHVLRRSDVVAREKAGEVSVKIPDDFYVAIRNEAPKRPNMMWKLTVWL
jgi:hypothetical protein